MSLFFVWVSRRVLLVLLVVLPAIRAAFAFTPLSIRTAFTTKQQHQECNECLESRKNELIGWKSPQHQFVKYEDTRWILWSSSTAASNMENAFSNATTQSSSNFDAAFGIIPKTVSNRVKGGIPWGEVQKWALRDKIKKYTITVPVAVEETGKIESFILWRALVEDTPEFMGYPISFLVECLEEITSKHENDGDDMNQSTPSASRQVLPFLDEFVFESNGGLSGRIYGMMGVAEGTYIQTAPVANVEMTLSKSFVQTVDGRTVYEIGKPAEDQVSSFAAGATTPTAFLNAMNGRVKGALSTTAGRQGGLVSNNDEESFLDPDLVNLAGLTGVVLAGAYALESLSHHLTVNVFWV